MIMLGLGPGIGWGASKQSVMRAGTKVSSATKNTVVNEECQDKYNGCMDSFCVIDNLSGGRCVCSDKYEKLRMMEQKLDAEDIKTAKLATSGINMLETDVSARARGGRIDLSLWNTADSDDDDEDDEVADASQFGDVALKSAHATCRKRVSGCERDIDLLYSMYVASIRSDCVAYENSLKEQTTQSKQKRTAAKSALAQAALDKYHESNKYDLGQCVIKFRECMTTTAECGDDFAGCVAAGGPSQVGRSLFTIRGTLSGVDIYQETYDILDAKRPICENVLQKCDDVRDGVWDAFMREIAPTLKIAEMIADDNSRQDCIGNVSTCFQNACRDNIGPKMSYDMCLTRPGSMMSFCKPELNACGVDTSSVDKAETSGIWEFVLARLAGLRVNSCTDQVRECLTDASRCGPDYSNCVGLSTNNILRMCPYDKMNGCQKHYKDTDIHGDDVYDELYNVVQGIMVNMDNALQARCERAVDDAVVRVCGDAEDCHGVFTLENVGADSLQYAICTLKVDGDNQLTVDSEHCWNDVDSIPGALLGADDGSLTGMPGFVAPMAIVIAGTIYWENVTLDDNAHLVDVDEYLSKTDIKDVPKEQRELVAQELARMQANIDSIIHEIESDPIVQYCMTGRDLPVNAPGFDAHKKPRYPNITKMTRKRISESVLRWMRSNYYEKYDKLVERQAADYARITEIIEENTQSAADSEYIENVRSACVDMAEYQGLARSKTPTSNIGTVIVVACVVIAIVVASVVTFGAAGAAAGVATAVVSGTVAAAEATAAAVATGMVLSAGVPAALATAIGAAAGTAAATAAISAAATAGAIAGITAAAGTIAGAAVAGAAVAGAVTAGVNAAVAKGQENKETGNSTHKMKTTGYHESNSWNYRQKIETSFSYKDLSCTTCIRSQNCAFAKDPIFGKWKCNIWEPESDPVCTTISFK